jgi:hypothetical protein
MGPPQPHATLKVAHQPTRLSRLASAIRACRVRRIGRCNIFEIFKNIVLFLKLLKKLQYFKKITENIITH